MLRGFATPRGPLDLDIRHGEVVLLRGANGSGKTSLLRALAGLPAAGSAAGGLSRLAVEPGPLATWAPRAGMSALATADGPNPEAHPASLYSDPAALPAADLARLLQFAKQDPAETLAGLTVDGEFRLRGARSPPAMADLSERDVATLSSGEARRVSLAVVGATPVPLLLLDEPMEGLDSAGRRGVHELIADHATQGAVVVADHGEDVVALATRILDLSPRGPLATFSFPSGPAGPIVAAPATVVNRADRPIVLPAVRLGAGFHVVCGPNASGKSTLLLHLAGLLGSGALVDGGPPQPGASVQLLLPRAADLFTREAVANELAAADEKIVGRLLPRDLLHRHPMSLSAGEAQRVALAKTLGRVGRLYLLDEPEAHLDATGRTALLETVAERIAAGACVLAATHDAQLLALAHSTIALGAP